MESTLHVQVIVNELIFFLCLFLADVPPLLSELFSPLHSCITIQSPSLRGRTLFLHDILIKRPNDLPSTKPVHTAGTITIILCSTCDFVWVDYSF